MEKRKISARELVSDIHAGMDFPSLMHKYEITSKNLQSALKQLVTARFLEQSLADELVLGPKRGPSTVWRCPKCSHVESSEFTECPICGIVVAKFEEIQKRTPRGPDLDPFFEQCVYAGIPVVPNPAIVVKKGEEVYYVSPVKVVQQKTQTKTLRTYIGSRVKIGKIPIYFGASNPHPYSEEVMSTLGTGYFFITNKRVVLEGNKINYSIKLDAINGIEPFTDAVQIFNEGSRGGRFYFLDDPRRAATILHILLHDDGTPRWLLAANDGKTGAFARLLAGGLDPNVSSEKGARPLGIASRTGNLELTELLLTNGVNVNAKVEEGATPLMFACQEGHEAIAKRLLAGGADVTAKANNGATALILASQSGLTEVVRQLLYQGADVNAKGDNGATALILASQNGHSAVVRQLLYQGADVNAKADNGTTALILASQNGHSVVVQLLLYKDADVTAQVDSGATALSLATEKEHKEISELLVKYGAKT